MFCSVPSTAPVDSYCPGSARTSLALTLAISASVRGIELRDRVAERDIAGDHNPRIVRAQPVAHEVLQVLRLQGLDRSFIAGAGERDRIRMSLAVHERRQRAQCEAARVGLFLRDPG